MTYGDRRVGPTPANWSKRRFISRASGPEDVSMKLSSARECASVEVEIQNTSTYLPH